MEVARTEDHILLRLSHGEKVIESIEKTLADEQSTFLVVTGIGMLTDFELGYFDKGQYVKRTFHEPHELVALQGSVASEGEPRMHIHAVVADRQQHAFGGHLFRGRVWMSNEIGFLRLHGVESKRRIDKEKGVAVLHVSGQKS